MIIPVYFSPYNDELLYSWLSRLAEANGSSLSNFRKYYFNDINKANDTSSRFYGMFWKSRMYETFPSIKDILLKHSEYWADRIIYDEPVIAQMIFHLLYNKDEPLYDISIKNECTETHLRICPECLKEDIANGKDFHFKTWHAFKDVKMCYKHKCALYELDNFPQGNEVNGEKLVIEQNSYDIAKKFYDTYKNPYQTINVATKELNEKDATTIKGVYHEFEVINDYGGLLELRCKECGCIFIETLHAIKSGRDCPICELQQNIPEKMLATTPDFVLTKNISSLRDTHCIKHAACGRPKKSESVFSIAWDKKECICTNLRNKLTRKFADVGFTILDIEDNFELNRNRYLSNVKLLHNVCGTIFEKTINNYKVELPGCPLCSPPKKEIKIDNKTRFDLKLEKYTDGEYIRIGEYVNARTPIELLHQKCGKITSFLPMSFFQGHFCNCDSTILSKEDVNNYLLGFEQNFTVLEKPSIKSKYYKILFNDTGKTISITSRMIKNEATKSGQPLFFKRKEESK